MDIIGEAEVSKIFLMMIEEQHLYELLKPESESIIVLGFNSKDRGMVH